MIEFVFWISIFIIAYVYLGYPLVLLFLSSIFRQKDVEKKAIEPSVTLIISVYNEEGVLEEKLKNSLALQYPKEKLEIIVVSDNSNDKSDEITASFADSGIRLIRQTIRTGKTLALNTAVPEAKGDVVVFSDANAMYQSDAIKKLVRNFNDPEVGYVAGDARYIKTEDSSSGMMEDLYWKYERWVKKRETSMSSMVGSDGAIHAIRKNLYDALLRDDINDFVNPLQIISKGYRGIYEPEAVCFEKPEPRFYGEFKRKVRVVNRSWRGLFRVPELLNPFRFGLYSLMLISHKLLRWLIPVFLGLVVASNLVIYPQGITYRILLGIEFLFFGFAAIGWGVSFLDLRIKVFLIPYYLCLVNLAALIGVSRALRGRTPAVWEPTRTIREKGKG